MTPRRKRALALITLIFLFGLPMSYFFSSHEPEYEDIKLSEWVGRLGTARKGRYTDHQATRAVQEIGTNAIPFLLEWLTAEDPTPVGRFIFKYAPSTLRPSRDPHSKTAHRTDSVPDAFHVLGNDASAAIPRLVEMLQIPEERLSAQRAARSLATIGPLGIPPLVQATTHTNSIIRMRAVIALASAQTNGTAAVTALIKALDDPDELVTIFAWNSLRDLTSTSNIFSIIKERVGSSDAGIRRNAIMMLHSFPFDRTATLQVLTQALSDPVPQVRRQATNTLRGLQPSKPRQFAR